MLALLCAGVIAFLGLATVAVPAAAQEPPAFPNIIDNESESIARDAMERMREAIARCDRLAWEAGLQQIRNLQSALILQIALLEQALVEIPPGVDPDYYRGRIEFQLRFVSDSAEGAVGTLLRSITLPELPDIYGLRYPNPCERRVGLVDPPVGQLGPAAGNPTFGQATAAALNLQANEYCSSVGQWVRNRYTTLAVTAPAARSRLTGWRPSHSPNVVDGFGTYIPDLDDDGIGDLDWISSSSSSSFSSSSDPFSSDSSGPLEYVRVSSLYGDGFYYIPGTETCLKIGGFVSVGAEYSTVGGAFVGTRANLFIDARTQTEYGTLRAYLGYNAFADFQAGGVGVDLGFNRAFIQMAGFSFGQQQASLTAGLLTSTYDYQKPFVWAGGAQSNEDVVQFRASTILNNGWAVDLALEGQEARGIFSDRPAIVIGVSPASNAYWRGSVALADTPYGLGVAAQIGAGFDLTPRLSVRGVVSAARYLDAYTGGVGAGPDNYAGLNLSGLYQTETPWDLVGGFGVHGVIGGPMEWNATIGAHRSLPRYPNAVIGAELTGTAGFGNEELQLLVRVQYNFQP